MFEYIFDKINNNRRKNIFDMNKEELQSILDNADDYRPDIIEIVKMQLGILEKDDEEKPENEDFKQSYFNELLKRQENIEYYLENISKKISGISFILWACFICSIMTAIVYVISMTR